MLLMDLMTIGMFISNRQTSSALSFGSWIVLGLITGFIASVTLPQKSGSEALYGANAYPAPKVTFLRLAESAL